MKNTVIFIVVFLVYIKNKYYVYYINIYFDFTNFDILSMILFPLT